MTETTTTSVKTRQLLWEPSPQRIASSRLNGYLDWLRTRRGLDFAAYDDLWKWSTTEPTEFWRSLWDFFEINASEQPSDVLVDSTMPGTRWFPGARLNWAQNVLAHHNSHRPAVIALGDNHTVVELSWAELTAQTASLAAELRKMGVHPGDRIAGYLPNIPEAVIALLATASLGATWVVCPPEYGPNGVLERFQQVEPTILIAADGYRFGGKAIDRMDVIEELRAQLPTVQQSIIVRNLQPNRKILSGAMAFDDLVHGVATPMYEQVPFEHPLWILYSSGTTGLPKGIVHSHGGILLEHLKVSALQMDTSPEDRVFVYTSTGWMLWNMLVSSLAVGATIITYDGSPAFPGPDALFAICAANQVTRFTTGAAYLTACQRSGIHPAQRHDLTSLRSISSTGSPLPESTWQWIYDAVGADLHLSSDCGGTDVCSGFVGGNPMLPVYAGELQAPYLGVSIEAWTETGQPVTGEVGEMVITAPMPSMPIRFWNDPDGTLYRKAYFDTFPGVWRHGDWMTVTENGTYVVHGRSDTTINRGGVRMGSADIYAAVQALPEVTDSLVIGVELSDGNYYMPLFVVLAPSAELDDELTHRVCQTIREHVSPRHVPDDVIAAPSVPVTVTGKKLELPIKRILQGTAESKAVNRAAVANPDSLDWYIEFARRFRESPDTH